MSDHDDEPAAVSWRASTAQVVLVSVMVVALGVLGPSLSEPGRAAVTVGIVLAEAIALYVGYGALARAADPVVRERLVSH
ncbi:DUF7512 family protein [Natronorubrum sp. FCH18a]|uniref:DUF7512 family protein n=1 Tax=Natronorubrum sp. FCH18a TaxID=3447018 RepID=UPI003F519A15